MNSLDRDQNKISNPTNDDYDDYEKEYVIKGRRHGRNIQLGDIAR